MLTEPFKKAREVLKRIEQSNHQAFFVGGCVRDFLLNRPLGDVDIATSASPDQIMKVFTKVIPVGIEHGTVVVRYKKVSYEVTTYRRDGKYSDQRQPDSVGFISTIEEDLQRRDFTINALAMNKEGNIIDPLDGRQDLTNKVIRSVGNGLDRFTEDPLRMIRALRFTSQLGFVIEKETLNNMKQLKNQIEALAVERITNEFTKLFAGNHINHAVNYLLSTEIYKHLPIIKQRPYIIENLPKELKPLRSFAEVIALFHHIDPDVEVIHWIKEWKCSNKVKNEANQLVKALDYYAKNGLDTWGVYQLSSTYFRGFMRILNTIYINNSIEIKDILQINSELVIQSKQDLVLKGTDIIEMFPNIEKGPWIHDIIIKMEKNVVLKKIKNTKSELKEWIKCNPPEIN